MSSVTSVPSDAIRSSASCSSVRAWAVFYNPGPIETEMLTEWTGEERVKRLKTVPMRRTGSVEEIAHTVLFLLSDAASYTTGTNLRVSGGR